LVRLVAGARPDDKDPPEALRPFEDIKTSTIKSL
jgi:hypothetical protein